MRGKMYNSQFVSALSGTFLAACEGQNGPGSSWNKLEEQKKKEKEQGRYTSGYETEHCKVKKMVSKKKKANGTYISLTFDP